MRYAWRDGGGWQRSGISTNHVAGQHTSLAIDSNDYPHISYYDQTGEQIKYTYGDGAGWHTDVIDKGYNIGSDTSLVLDGQDQPHIAYQGYDNYRTFLKYASYETTQGWQIESLAAVDQEGADDEVSISLQLDSNGRAHIAFEVWEFLPYPFHYSRKPVYSWQNGVGWETNEGVNSSEGIALVLDHNDLPYVVYQRELSLLYSQPTKDCWSGSLVYRGMDAGKFASLDIDQLGRVHIAALDQGNTELKYTRQDAMGWTIETPHSAGWHASGRVSMVLGSDNQPRVLFDNYMRINNALYGQRHKDSGVWTVDGWQESLGFYQLKYQYSLAVDQADMPHAVWIYYTFDETVINLIYGYRSITGTLLTEGIASGANDDAPTAIALDRLGRPHVAYQTTDGNLRYARRTVAAGWVSTTVDNMGDVGQFVDLALDSRNRPHLSYYDMTNGDLKYAFWTGVTWQKTTVDNTDDVGQYTSIALDAQDNPHISYYDVTNGDLKYAHLDSDGWQIIVVDSAGDVGQFTSLDLFVTPHIAYYDFTRHGLKYAHIPFVPTNVVYLALISR